MTLRIFPLAKGVVALALVGAVGYSVRQAVQAQPAQTPSIGGFVAPVDVDTTSLPGPVQPIFYRHDIHAGQYEIDCRYCHYGVEVSSSPNLPTGIRSCGVRVGIRDDRDGR